MSGTRSVQRQCVRSSGNHRDQNMCSWGTCSPISPMRRFHILAKRQMGECARRPHRVVQWIQWTQAHGQISMRAAFLSSVSQLFRPGARIDSLGIVRADRRRPFESAETCFQISLEPVGAPHGEVDERIQWIEFHASLGEASRVAYLRGDIIRVPHECALEVYERQASVSTREAGVQGDGPLKQAGRGDVIQAIKSYKWCSPKW